MWSSASALRWVLAVVVVVTTAGAQEAAVDASWREEVLHAYRRGLLAEASRQLERLGPDASRLDRGWAANMAGNIAYERGDFVRASAHYSRAVELLEPVGAAAVSDLAMARGNRVMAEERRQRAQTLGAELSGLRVATWVLGLAGLGLVLVLGRRA